MKKHFCAANDDEYQQFITALLNHSPLNVDANAKKNLIPEKEPLNKKIEYSASDENLLESLSFSIENNYVRSYPTFKLAFGQSDCCR